MGETRVTNDKHSTAAGRRKRTRGYSDEQIGGLIARSLTGDVRAFEALVKSYHGEVYAYALRMVGRVAADDVTQDVFVRVYRSLHTYRGDAAFATWLYRITHNVCIDHNRRRQRDRGRIISLERPDGADEEPLMQRLQDRRAVNPENRTLDRELEEALYEALMQLTDKHRAVIVLHDMHGFRYDEIAQIVRCSLGTVKSRLYYARRALREQMTPFLDEGGWSRRPAAPSPSA